MPTYPYGKQLEVTNFKDIQKKVADAKVSPTNLAYFWILYYYGVRKSEAYELTTDDIKISKENISIIFHRKKHGAQVPAIQIPLSFPGANLIIKQYEKSKQKKLIKKRIKFSNEKHEPQIEYRKAKWLFPFINETYANTIIKKVLGKKYYPHYLRLNRISELCQDPTVNITRIKSFTGIKTLNVIQAYMGTSEKEQQEAINFIGKQITKKP